MELQPICELMATAMRRAGAEYMDMTNGHAPWWAPESWFRDAAARELARRRDLLVSLEETAETLRQGSTGRRVGRYPGDSRTQRVDLVLWNPGAATPRMLVEFKRSMAPSQLRHDAEFLRKFGSSQHVKFGLLCTIAKYSTSSARDAVAETAGGINAEPMCHRTSVVEDADEGDVIRVIFAVFRVL